MDPSRFPQPGDLFDGRYRIESILGTGGYAQVFAATQTELDRAVAVKVLSRDDIRDADKYRDVGRRFRREAQLVSRLRNPHTVTVFDYGESPDGLLYIVLERIEGRSLRELIEQEAPISAERVVAILQKVLSSLREAHLAGILHRDIKPENIMAFHHLGNEEVKLLDFGVAKIARHSDAEISALTRVGSLIGTPRYMAPEQIQHGQAGPTSDVFALGLVAYELLSGQRANSVADPVGVMGRQLDEEPFLLPLELPIPSGLQHVVHGMLKKDPMDRYQTANEVLAALENWGSNRQELARTLQAYRPGAPKLQPSERSLSMPMGPQRTVVPQHTAKIPQQTAPEEPQVSQMRRLIALFVLLAALGLGLAAAMVAVENANAASESAPQRSNAAKSNAVKSGPQ